MNNNNLENLRSTVAVLNSKINNMCNVKTVEEVSTEFVAIKDLLIAVYKLNLDRVSK